MLRHPEHPWIERADKHRISDRTYCNLISLECNENAGPET